MLEGYNLPIWPAYVDVLVTCHEERDKLEAIYFAAAESVHGFLIRIGGVHGF